MLVLNVATECVHEKQSHKTNPSRGTSWEKLQRMFLVGFSALVNSKCALGNDAETKGNQEEGARECAAAMAHPAAEGVTAEQSRAPSRAEIRAEARTGRARPATRRSGRGTDRRKRPAGRRADGRPGQAVYVFLAILCYSQSGDDPQEDLARFG
jgi:hypothetical protein